jgi:hypothetical protein
MLVRTAPVDRQVQWAHVRRAIIALLAPQPPRQLERAAMCVLQATIVPLEAWSQLRWRARLGHSTVLLVVHLWALRAPLVHRVRIAAPRGSPQ